MRIIKTCKEHWLIVIILLLAVVIRLLNLGLIPGNGGINQDEAYAGYEAYSLLHSGMDSHGYVNPIYFISWGSGMNVLYSYLSMPFISLMGLTNLSIRLPQAIFSILTILCLYKIVNKTNGKVQANLLCFLVSISPWHILLSRWGLESNLAVAFLIFGLYFWILSLDNNKYLIFSAFFYGLSLYAYALLWIIVPIIILLQFFYSFYYKKLKINFWFIISTFLLFILALPLLLFILVNIGYCPEIRFSFMSIPKLPDWRSNELGSLNLLKKLNFLIGMVLKQDDGNLWNAVSEFGSYYKISTPFIVIGGYTMFVSCFKSIKLKIFSYELFWMIQLISAVILALMISDININRVNCIHIPIIYLCMRGIIEFIHQINKKVTILIFAVYILLFGLFLNEYFGEYNEKISVAFGEGLNDALELVGQNDCILEDGINYAKVAFFTEVPVEQFINTVKYTNYPNQWLNVSQFVNYKYGIDLEHIDKSKKYIFTSDYNGYFMKSGFIIQEFKNYKVAYCK